MTKKMLFVVVVLYLLSGESIDALSCSKVVQTKSKELFSYLATVTFPAPKSFKGQWQLDMKTDVPFLFLGAWGVVVNENGTGQAATFHSADDVTLKSGEPVTFNFRISWPPREPVPLVKELVWENQHICTSTTRTNEIRKIKKQQRTIKYFL